MKSISTFFVFFLLFLSLLASDNRLQLQSTEGLGGKNLAAEPEITDIHEVALGQETDPIDLVDDDNDATRNPDVDLIVDVKDDIVGTGTKDANRNDDHGGEGAGGETLVGEEEAGAEPVRKEKESNTVLEEEVKKRNKDEYNGDIAEEGNLGDKGVAKAKEKDEPHGELTKKDDIVDEKAVINNAVKSTDEQKMVCERIGNCSSESARSKIENPEVVDIDRKVYAKTKSNAVTEEGPDHDEVDTTFGNQNDIVADEETVGGRTNPKDDLTNTVEKPLEGHAAVDITVDELRDGETTRKDEQHPFDDTKRNDIIVKGHDQDLNKDEGVNCEDDGICPFTPADSKEGNDDDENHEKPRTERDSKTLEQGNQGKKEDLGIQDETAEEHEHSEREGDTSVNDEKPIENDEVGFGNEDPASAEKDGVHFVDRLGPRGKGTESVGDDAEDVAEGAKCEKDDECLSKKPDPWDDGNNKGDIGVKEERNPTIDAGKGDEGADHDVIDNDIGTKDDIVVDEERVDANGEEEKKHDDFELKADDTLKNDRMDSIDIDAGNTDDIVKTKGEERDAPHTDQKDFIENDIGTKDDIIADEGERDEKKAGDFEKRTDDSPRTDQKDSKAGDIQKDTVTPSQRTEAPGSSLAAYLPVIDFVVPTVVYLGTDTKLVVEGKNFNMMTRCMLGGKEIQTQLLTESRMSCVAPPFKKPHEEILTLTNEGNDDATSTQRVAIHFMLEMTNSLMKFVEDEPCICNKVVDLFHNVKFVSFLILLFFVSTFGIYKFLFSKGDPEEVIAHERELIDEESHGFVGEEKLD